MNVYRHPVYLEEHALIPRGLTCVDVWQVELVLTVKEVKMDWIKMFSSAVFADVLFKILECLLHTTFRIV